MATPRNKEQEKSDQLFLWLAAGGMGVGLVFGAAKLVQDFRGALEEKDRFREPWERGPGT